MTTTAGRKESVKGQVSRARDLPERSRRDRFVGPPNIGALLRSRAAERTEKPLLVWRDRATGERQVLPYGFVRDRVEMAGRAIAGVVGLAPGERVVCLAATHPDIVLFLLAAWRAGVSVVTVDPAADHDRLRSIILETGARAVAALPGDGPGLEPLRRRLRKVSHWIRVGTGNAPNGWRSFGRDQEKALLVRSPADVAPDQEALVIYEDGADGRPLGIILDHYDLLVSAHVAATWNGLGDGAVGLSQLPLHAAEGIVLGVLANLYGGGGVALVEDVDPLGFWTVAREEQITWAPIRSAFAGALVEAAGEGSGFDRPEGITHLVCGRGPLPADVARRVETRFGLALAPWYGLPEATCTIGWMPLDLSRGDRRKWLGGDGNVAVVVCDTNVVAIHDAEGKEVPEGERGEVVVRGHNLMVGYVDRAETSRAAFAHGWFRTGDEGCLQRDAAGRSVLTVTGRRVEVATPTVEADGAGAEGA